MNTYRATMPPDERPCTLAQILTSRGGYRYLVDLVFHLYTLTPLERKIGHLMLRGQYYQHIAQQLFLSESAIKAYAQRIFAKMRLKNRHAFAQYVHALIASL